MANGKVIAGGIAGLGLLGLLAWLASEAKADTPTPSRVPDAEDPYTVEACDAYYVQREAVYAKRAAIKGQLVEIDAALMAAYANDADQATVMQLLAAKTGQSQALAAANAQIAELDTLIANCPSRKL